MPGIELFSVWRDDSEWSNLIFWADLDMHRVLDNVETVLRNPNCSGLLGPCHQAVCTL